MQTIHVVVLQSQLYLHFGLGVAMVYIAVCPQPVDFM